MSNKDLTRVEPLQLPETIPQAINAWLLQNEMKPSTLAEVLGITRFFLSDILAGRRALPDGRIKLLPQGLRWHVAQIRAQHYKAMAWLVLHDAEQADRQATRRAAVAAEGARAEF